jgi:hypothetical protein
MMMCCHCAIRWFSLEPRCALGREHTDVDHSVFGLREPWRDMSGPSDAEAERLPLGILGICVLDGVGGLLAFVWGFVLLSEQTSAIQPVALGMGLAASADKQPILNEMSVVSPSM